MHQEQYCASEVYFILKVFEDKKKKKNSEGPSLSHAKEEKVIRGENSEVDDDLWHLFLLFLTIASHCTSDSTVKSNFYPYL